MDLKLAAVALLLSTVTVASGWESYGWKQGHEYVYKVKGRVLSGQPELKHQYAGFELKYKAIIQVPEKKTLVIKPVDIVSGEINEAIVGEEWATKITNKGDSSSFKSEIKHQLETPFVVKLEFGKVTELKVKQGEPTFVVNFKKSLASALLLNNNILTSAGQQGSKAEESSDEAAVLQDISSTLKDTQNKRESAQKLIKIKEEGISGECEVIYERHQIPESIIKANAELSDVERRSESEPVWLITKTTNFSRCANEQFPVFQTLTPKGASNKPGISAEGQYWERTYQSRVVISNGLIQKISNEEEFLVQPLAMKTEKTYGSTTLNITLKNVEKIREQIHVPGDLRTISSVVYTFPLYKSDSGSGSSSGDESYGSDQWRRDTNEDADEDESDEERPNFSWLPNILGDSSEEAYDSRYKYDTTGDAFGRRHGSARHAYGRRYPSSSKVSTKYGRDYFEGGDYEDKEQGDDYEGQGLTGGKKPGLTKAAILVNPRRLPFSRIISEAPLLARDIARDLETPEKISKKNVLGKIETLSKLLELLSYDQLKEVYQKTTGGEKEHTSFQKQTAKQIFLDAMTITGTNPSVILLKDLIERGELRGEQAAQLIATIPKYTKTPTRELVKELFNILKHIDSSTKTRNQLYTTTLLAFTTLVRQSSISPRAQVTKYPVYIFGKFGSEHESEITQEYIPYLINKLQSSQKPYQQAVYVQALGNIGHKEIYPILKKIIKGEFDTTTQVKSKAVFALTHLVSRHSYYRKNDPKFVETVQQFLTSTVLNTQLDHKVRLSAFSVAVYSDIPLVYLQKIAMRTWFEPSNQVVSYIRTTLKSLANLKAQQPRLQNLINKSKQVLQLVKPIKEGFQYSFNYIASRYSQELQFGFIQQIATFGSKHSLIPEAVYFGLTREAAGFNYMPIELGINTFNVEHLYQKVLREKSLFPLTKGHQYDSLLDQIKEQLQLDPKIGKGQLDGSAFLRISGEIQRMFPIDEEAIEYLIQLVAKAARNNEGIPVNYQKVLKTSEVTLIIPTQLGLPYFASAETTGLISLKGEIKIRTEPQLSEGTLIPEKISVILDVNPLYTWRVMARTGFARYSNLKTYETGVERRFKFFLPGAIVLSADLKNNQFAVKHVLPSKSKIQDPSKIEIVTYKVIPYTAIDKLNQLAPVTDSKNFKVIKTVKELNQKTKHFGQKYFGLSFTLEQESEQDFEDINDIFKKISKNGLNAGLYYLSAAQTLRFRKYQLNLDLTNSETKETKIVATFDQITKAIKKIGSTGSNVNSGYQSDSDEVEEYQRRGKPFFPSKWSNEDNEEIYGERRQQQWAIDSDEQDQYQNRRPRRHQKHHQQKNQYSDYDEQESEYYNNDDSKDYNDDEQETGYESGNKQKLRSGYLAHQILKNTRSGVVYTTDLSLIASGPSSSAQREYSAHFAIGSGIAKPTKNVNILFVRSPLEGRHSGKPYVVKIESEIKFPQVPEINFNAIRELDITSVLKAKVTIGHSIEKQDAQIRIEGVMKQNQEVAEYLETLKKTKECQKYQAKGIKIHQTCQNVTQIAAMLNEYRFNIEYDNVPAEIRNATYHVEDFLTAVWYPYMSHDQVDVRNGEKKIRITIKVHPLRRNYDIKINKPTADIYFHQVPFDTQINSVFPINAKKTIATRISDKLFGEQNTGKCHVGQKAIVTFDNVVYGAELGNCYHLLAQQRNGHFKFAVLAKEENGEKVTKVIVQNTQIKIQPQQARVTVNGRSESIPKREVIEVSEQGYVVARIGVSENGVVVLDAPIHGLKIKTNGKYIITKVSQTYRGTLAGLCGDFNGEKTADLKTPRKCVEDSETPQRFLTSYILSNGKCDARSTRARNGRIGAEALAESSNYGQSVRAVERYSEVQESQCVREDEHITNIHRLSLSDLKRHYRGQQDSSEDETDFDQWTNNYDENNNDSDEDENQNEENLGRNYQWGKTTKYQQDSDEYDQDDESDYDYQKTGNSRAGRYQKTNMDESSEGRKSSLWGNTFGDSDEIYNKWRSDNSRRYQSGQNENDSDEIYNKWGGDNNKRYQSGQDDDDSEEIYGKKSGYDSRWSAGGKQHRGSEYRNEWSGIFHG